MAARSKASGAELACTGDDWDAGVAASLGGAEEAWALPDQRSNVEHRKPNLNKFSGPSSTGVGTTRAHGSLCCEERAWDFNQTTDLF